MAAPECDILIVGGGIYGCGIAQAAAVSGYKVMLAEKYSIASGTSSQSTKLIHGGLRYLEQGNLKLVYEALDERETLLRIAPSLVTREWFYIPVYRGSRRPWWFIGCGLLLYWLLSFGRSRFRRLPSDQWAKVLPGLDTVNLCAVLAYEDAATDDAALTRAVAASAVSFGCKILERRRLISAACDGGLWQVDFEDGTCCTTRLLVNACGPWMEEVCSRITPSPPQVPVRLVQGTHLVLDRSCPAYIYTESTDGRVMFFRPWQGKVLAGTTETPLDVMPEKPDPTAEEVHAILATYKRYFPDSPCTEEDILGSYCGARVLPSGGQGAFAASRETVILADDKRRPGYIGVYGGKLTTYRREAEKVLRLIGRSLPVPHKADTRKIPLEVAAADSG